MVLKRGNFCLSIVIKFMVYQDNYSVYVISVSPIVFISLIWMSAARDTASLPPYPRHGRRSVTLVTTFVDHAGIVENTSPAKRRSLHI